MASPLVIRPARAGDADFLAWAILTAARSHLSKGWFDFVLDRPEKDCLAFLRQLTLTPTPSWWHHSRFSIAVSEGEAVGALCTFRAGDAYPLSQQALVEAAGALAIPPAEQDAMWQRGGYLFSCVLDGDDEAWTIENVATLPSARGGGVAGALLAHAVDLGRAAKRSRALITFLIGNDPAERAYAKAGFTLESEKRSAAFEAVAGAPGLRRFMRSL
jgi:translation initiation factor 4G